MLGRTIKTTNITVPRTDPTRKDWWVCRCPCGGKFIAQGWNVSHARNRDCRSDEHITLPGRWRRTLEGYISLRSRSLNANRMWVLRGQQGRRATAPCPVLNTDTSEDQPLMIERGPGMMNPYSPSSSLNNKGILLAKPTPSGLRPPSRSQSMGKERPLGGEGIMPKQEYTSWFDGACGPVNPGGTATYGIMIKDQDGTILVWEHGLVGEGSAMSNNVAEYAGVLQILKYLSYRPPGRITIHGDSNLVISQLNGKWRMRKGLYLSTAKEAKALLAQLQSRGWEINLCWIPRALNKECDALSKQAFYSAGKPTSTQQKVCKQRDPRDKSMLGRTVKTTGITVLRAAPKGGDWWVCKCPCGREFVAHGWNVRHGRARNCGSDEHKARPRELQVLASAM